MKKVRKPARFVLPILSSKKRRNRDYLMSIFIVMLLLTPLYMFAQESILFASNYVYTPSTNAWGYMKYGGTQPSLYTGAVTETIPFYVYQDEDFNIPISFVYGSNGFKPNTQSGPVGLGWHLEWGGVITRTIRGVPDEDSHLEIKGFLEVHNSGVPQSGYTTYEDPLFQYDGIFGKKVFSREGDEDGVVPIVYYGVSLASEQTYRQIRSGSISRFESTPDLFQFNFMGYSGSFQLNYNGVIDVFNTSGIARGEVKITKIKRAIDSSTGTSIIEISAGDGYLYIFGGAPSALDSSFSVGEDDSSNEIELVTNAWYISKIIAPNGREVNFKYQTVRPAYIDFYPSAGHVICGAHNAREGGGFQINNEPAYIGIRPATISQIEIPGVCQIDFNYASKTNLEHGEDRWRRIDIIPYCNEWSTINLGDFQKALSSITVKELSSDQIVKRCDLTHKYTQGNPKMLLENIKISGEGNYGFGYYNETNKFPTVDTYAIDAWGYWNGIATRSTFLPTREYGANVLDEKVIGTSRDAVYENTLYGMLKRIQYPTGGWSEYIYEQNDYSMHLAKKIERSFVNVLYSVSKTAGPGVRVARINTYNGANTTSKSYYYRNEYNDALSTSGILLHTPRYNMRFNVYFTITVGYHSYNIDLPGYEFNSLLSTPMEYGRVYEVLGNGSIMEYNFADYRTKDDFSNTNNEITSMASELRANATYVHNLVKRVNRNNGRGMLLSKIYYDSSKKPVYKEAYDYNTLGTGGVNCYKFGIDMFYECSLETYNHELASVTRTNYSNGVPDISEITENSYNHPYGQLIKTTLRSSADNIKKITYNAYSTELSPTLVQKGIRRAKIHSVDVIKNGNEAERIIAATFYDYNSIIKPRRIRKAVINTPITRSSTNNINFPELNTIGKFAKIEFKYNNNHRIVEIKNDFGIYTSYIWSGQHGLYPIARIDNASIDKITSSYGSFTGIKSLAFPRSKFNNLELNALRGINNSQVFVYEFQPLVGLTKEIDPSGRITTYDYNNKAKLVRIKDDNGNKINEYEYSADKY